MLSDLVRRIMKQEGRHFGFYDSEVRRRREKDRRAQYLVWFALTTFWSQWVASGSTSEVAPMGSYLFADEDWLVAASRVDRRSSRLPGLDGLVLVETAAGREGLKIATLSIVRQPGADR